MQDDVKRELAAHLQMRQADLIAAGFSAQEARREALRSFGDLDSISDECCRITDTSDITDARRSFVDMLDSLWQDLVYAARRLRHEPAFVAAAVLTLAVGIGANTAIFSVVDAVLLRPLPYSDPDRLVALWERAENGGESHVSPPNFVDWYEQSSSFNGMAAHPTYSFGGRSTVLGGDSPARIYVSPVSADFFSVFGTEPLHGRVFASEEHVEGGGAVAVVSHRYWRTHLASEAKLDRELRFFGEAYDIVGVMPPGFEFPGETDVWIPGERFGGGGTRSAHNFAVVARLGPDVTVEQASSELNAIATTLKALYPDDNDAVGVNVRPLHDQVVGGAKRSLWLLFGAAGPVLLVGCSNLASGLLARAASREREMATRAAIGAGRLRVVRQLLTENLLLALLGAGVGWLVAATLLRTLVLAGASSLPSTFAPQLDSKVLTFTLVLALGTTLAFGLLPALGAGRLDLTHALRSGGRGSAGAGRRAMWQLLVATEVALAVLLLVGCGLLLRSFAGLVAIDTGFEPDNVLTVDIALPATEYADDDAIVAYYDRALREIGALSGATRSGLINHAPLSGNTLNGAFDFEECPGENGSSSYRVVSADYFQALGIELLDRRGFAASDDAAAAPVVIVNEELARRFWPGESESVIGERIGNLRNDSFVYGDAWMTIVGVVGNVRHADLTRPPAPAAYVHYRQRPFRARGATLVVQTSAARTGPAGLAATIRDRIEQLNTEVPFEISSMEARLASSLAPRRFGLALVALFAAAGLLLATVGIYSVVSYTVAQRTCEIGIRIALGGQPAQLRRLVVANTLGVVGAGAVVGIGASLLLGRGIQRLLFDVGPSDPITLATVTLLLLVVASAASYVPARRGTRVDPVASMRSGL